MKKKLWNEEEAPEVQEAEEKAEAQTGTASIEQEPLGEIPPEPPTVKRRRPKHVKYVPCI